MSHILTIITWNVNSVRARMDRLTGWLTDHRPDIVCLQETKVTDDMFPVEPLRELGYEAVFSGQKTYNGVAILSRLPITDVGYGFQGDNSEEQKRLISATIQDIRVVNLYVPQGAEVGSSKFADKLDFLARLAGYLEENHRPDEPLALVGDFNVAPEPVDVFSPEEMEGQVGFHPTERTALEEIRRWGFSDLFRKYQPNPGHYSWWDYRQGGFRRNRGLRLDHVWVTEPLSRRSRECWIDREARAGEKPSDHAPVVATFTGDMD